MKFSAVVLAAGMSSRMQGMHKMLLPIGAEPAIRRTVRQVLAANPQEVVVVTGHDGHGVTEALIDLPVSFQHNPQYQEGQMISVAVGVGALRQPTDAVMICLGDMVLLRTEDYREVVDAFSAMPRGSILVPRHDGRRGNPVMLAAHHAAEVMSGEKNIGCRKLIADHPEEVFAYEAAHDRYTTDMDTPEDYAAILVRLALAPTETA
jgi:molybdenum cofactor cytidylyltransferase